MADNDPNLEEIRIFNSENNTHYYLYIRKNRIQEFFSLITKDRHTAGSVSLMPGLTWAAVLGLDAIFDRRPEKFPVQDILHWFRDHQKQYLGEYPNPTITVREIENALERFSTLYPPDVRVGV